MPCDYKNYPSNWKQIRQDILEREGDCCKFCGVPNGDIGYRDENNKWHKIGNVYQEASLQADVDADDAIHYGYKVIKIVLTIMHLDHDTTHNEYSNLAAGCQKCHNNYDKEYRKANARKTIENKKGLQKLF